LSVERAGGAGAAGGSVRRDEVLAALRSVPEPCSIAMGRPTDICEMGLIEDVRIEGSRVQVTLVLTDPSCVHFTAMQRYISDALLELDGVSEVAVSMSTTQLWTPERRERRSEDAAQAA
jgi:metal-sulfur cluster biosynthetic enzyme